MIQIEKNQLLMAKSIRLAVVIFFSIQAIFCLGQKNISDDENLLALFKNKFKLEGCIKVDSFQIIPKESGKSLNLFLSPMGFVKTITFHLSEKDTLCSIHDLLLLRRLNDNIQAITNHDNLNVNSLVDQIKNIRSVKFKSKFDGTYTDQIANSKKNKFEIDLSLYHLNITGFSYFWSEELIDYNTTGASLISKCECNSIYLFLSFESKHSVNLNYEFEQRRRIYFSISTLKLIADNMLSLPSNKIVSF